MPSSLAPPSPSSRLDRLADGRKPGRRVTVACPDARPPAYQAAVGLANAGRLRSLVTGFYHRGGSRALALAGRLAPSRFASLESRLARRSIAEIPPDLVRPHPSFDAFLAVENRVGDATRGRVARWRTRLFDRSVAASLRSERPDAALIFSDVGSGFALPFCRSEGIPAVLSMVHGDVREEAEVLDRERDASPDFFRMYLADGPIAPRELGWLHDRRLRDLELARAVAVPSEHIAARLRGHGVDPSSIAVIPYAADTRRFFPMPGKRHDDGCFFLFAGGITQRKGIKYLLEAWRLVRRPSWRLGLLGGLPRERSPLEPYRDEVEWLGQVGHGAMPSAMSRADVFVFPSLFEGSAVVTYEAMACGLPSIVTAESGSVARDGRDGLIVPTADVESLAEAMERLGSDPSLREAMGISARLRAEGFGWPRYHSSLLDLIDRLS